MKEIEKKITEYITRNGMLRPGDSVLVAVSGGADSVCLLHVLWKLRQVLHLSVYAAHYEHGIRGEESARDCAFVEKWCAEREIPLTVEHGSVPAYAEQHGMGLEEAARTLRYAFLERTRWALDCTRIATAHTMDDQAETVLFHLSRGSGLSGLTGIPPVRGWIIRPFLCVRRQEIEACLAENGLTHVEDSTNSSLDCTRNRIRHCVLPELKQVSGGTVEAIFRSSELLRSDEECLSALADRCLENCGAGPLSAAELLKLHPAVASRVLRKCWPEALSREQTEAVMRILPSTERKQISLPGGTVTVDRGMLYFRPDGELGTYSTPADESRTPVEAVELRPGSVVEFPVLKKKIVCELQRYDGEVHDLFNTFALKCGEIYGPLLCGTKQPGDRLRVRGRNCTKTIKSLFLEAGYNRTQRDRTLVFRDGRGVLAVEGLALAECAAPRKGDTVWRIQIESTDDCP